MDPPSSIPFQQIKIDSLIGKLLLSDPKYLAELELVELAEALKIKYFLKVVESKYFLECCSSTENQKIDLNDFSSFQDFFLMKISEWKKCFIDIDLPCNYEEYQSCCKYFAKHPKELELVDIKFHEKIEEETNKNSNIRKQYKLNLICDLELIMLENDQEFIAEKGEHVVLTYDSNGILLDSFIKSGALLEELHQYIKKIKKNLKENEIYETNLSHFSCFSQFFKVLYYIFYKFLINNI